MYKLSGRSIEKLRGTEPQLVVLLATAIRTSPHDYGIVEGVRSVARQQELYKQTPKVTEKDGIIRRSKHQDGEAVDIAIWRDGFVWVNEKAYKEVRNHIEGVADELGIKLRARINWDMGHYELKD